jgi:hypothetical protein
MANFNCYITHEERVELFSFILQNKGKIIPNMVYPDPSYKIITTVEEFIRIIESQTVGFFIISDNFQLEPLVLSKHKTEEAKYSIVQRKGGPAIDIALFRGFAETDIIKYKRTDLHCYSKYIDYNSHNEFYATDEIKYYFNVIVKFLKSKCKQISVGSNKYWVSKTLNPESIVKNI